jgi:EKC/KEOPS complex subunit CGI121/TPRKB
MSLLQTVQLEHLPPTHAIHIALYRNVTNAAFLQQQLLAGNTDFEYALIDAGVVRVPFLTPPLIPSHRPHANFILSRDNEVRLMINLIQIVSKIHALAATYRAVNDLLQNRLKSRNVHSEIVFSLSPNNNVRSSLACSSPFRYPPFCFFRLFPNAKVIFFTVMYDQLALF